MASKSNLIREYCKANSVSNVDFTTDVRLVDHSDGTGVHIEHWGLSIPQPTDEQLASYETAADTAESNAQVDATRKSQYGSWNEQLDEIFHSIDDWKARVQTIKNNNPKS